MKKEIIIYYKRKRINVIAEDCNFIQKFIGLMFSRREKAKILLFSFTREQKIKIHSFFVFYPFIAIWFDKKNRVVDLKIVEPFTLCIFPKKPVFNLVEIPINKKNKKILKNIISRRELETFKY